jgi:hypothetical protein
MILKKRNRIIAAAKNGNSIWKSVPRRVTYMATQKN